MTDLNMRDTIAAPATAVGQAGIGIIRISGDRAEDVLSRLFVPKAASFPLDSHRLYLGTLYSGEEALDECMAVLMRAPNSYTRQDVAELQMHGSPLVMERALDAVYRLGVRPAESGEFTLRAFLNGRIDLSQAEAVMQLIRSSSDRAAKNALRQLNGGPSGFVREYQQKLMDMLAALEAAIDYPDEVDDQLTSCELAQKAEALARELMDAVDERAQRIAENGLEAVLCGAPNAGKSTLLNALLGQQKAIVTDIPGTTRDIVEGEIFLDGYRVHLLDTAGLREDGDEVEKIGITRALQAARQADIVFWLTDAADPDAAPPPPGFPDAVRLYTKADLPGARQRADGILISARTGEGLSAVRDRLLSAIHTVGDTPLSSRRHMTLCRQAAESLRQAREAFSSGVPLEFGAVCLHDALDRLSEITGDNAGEQLLDRIFSQFCVGK